MSANIESASTCPARQRLLAGLAAGLPAQGMWSAPVAVAVSGGADSTALLLGLVALAPTAARLIVAHAEHDLRATAAEDRGFVVELADRLGLPCVWGRLAVRAADGAAGEGLEARARRLRYRFLEAVARDHGARHVLVAHTADDQAETILHRILRGTGLAGLAGMAVARELCDGVALLRPLLAVPRSDVREFLAAEAAAWREDATNADVRFTRNFLRHEILARCAAGPYPAAAAAVVRLGSQAGRMAAALRSAADHLLDAHAVRRIDGTVELRTAGLAGLDRHLLSEMFAALWERERWPRRDMTAAHYERLAALVRPADGSAAGSADFPGAVRVEPRAGGIIACRHRPSGVRQAEHGPGA
jgi:tRNA(Ile)-lysidine synthase